MIQYDTETKTNRKWKLLYTTEYSFHLRNELYKNKMVQPYQEEFEDTKGAIKIRISKKNRQHNGQKKVQKDKQRSTKHTYKTKDRQHIPVPNIHFYRSGHQQSFWKSDSRV